MVVVWQVPLASQQPVGQLSGVHLAAQAPALHVCAAVQVAQLPPPVPQAEDDSSVWHWPSVAQQPVAQVAAEQATVVASMLVRPPPSPPPP